MNVIQLEPKGMWSVNWLEELFSGPEFKHWPSTLHVVGGAFLIVPAEFWADRVDEVNRQIQNLRHCVLMLVSDECGLFPVEELVPVHSLWVMTPHFEKHEYPVGTNFMGEYLPRDAHNLIYDKGTGSNEKRPWMCSFSGQVTHERREQLARVMTATHNRLWYFNGTEGFAQGLARDDYYELLTKTQLVPAPSGPCTPDSFRVYEALEAGAIPMLDVQCPTVQPGRQYWRRILGEDHPLPLTGDWEANLFDWSDYTDEQWHHLHNEVFSWWQLHKREMRQRILSSSPEYVSSDDITILMPTSPVPSNPSLDKITQTIESVRFHHPTADIIILCDGVRPEQEHVRGHAYREFVSQLLWKANFEWTNIYPVVSPTWQHQANMTRIGLKHVNTPMILYVEHDIPLVTDMPIDWQGCKDIVRTGDIDMLKFSFEAMGIHPEHEHMAIDKEIQIVKGVPIRRTLQWSQRPHIARTRWYLDMLMVNFPFTSRTMIEDKMHGVAQEFPNAYRIATYMPEGSKVRCFHIDGREDDIKYEMRYE